MDSEYPSSDIGDANTPETPLPGTQKTCLRTVPCMQSECLAPTCSIPKNHVRDLTDAMDDVIEVTTVTKPTASPANIVRTSSKPRPPADHVIVTLTEMFLDAIQDDDLYELQAAMNLHDLAINSNLEFSKYDRTDLRAARNQAKQILASVAPQAPPPSAILNSPPIPPPSASFKPPKLVTDSWSGKSYDFYPWLSSVLNGFALARCDDPSKVMLTNQAIPLSKKGALANITDWTLYKARLIEEFGSIDIFGRDVIGVFKQLPRYESVQELAEDLAPKIKTLQANLEVVKQFHDAEDLYNVALTPNLNSFIMQSFPAEVRLAFNDKFQEFRAIDPSNVRSPATFQFIAQFVSDRERMYRSNPFLYDVDISPLNVGINAVKFVPQPTSSRQPRPQASTPAYKPRDPCPPCVIKGFENDHFPLSRRCGVRKLGSAEILKIISDNHFCPSCMRELRSAHSCKLVFPNGDSVVCEIGCQLNGFPVNKYACMHNDQTPSFTVSKVGSDKSIPLVESVNTSSSPISIHYDQGSEISLVSKSTLETLDPGTYTVGKTYYINLLPFMGGGSQVLATEVFLKLNGFNLQLYAIENELNNTSAFSIAMPNQWRAYARHSQLSHSGKISILLGGDNFHAFPREQDRNSSGTALFKSEISNKYLIFGRSNPKILKWREPVKNTPSPAIAPQKNIAPTLLPGDRKDDRQISPIRREPNPFFSRIQGHSGRINTPRTAGTAISLKMKPNQNWLQVPGETGANPLARPCEPNAANYKGWAQQPASIVEFLTGKDGTVYGAVLKFWKQDGAAPDEFNDN